jgi:glycosyltransferase involved in cell wall biosynthesis
MTNRNILIHLINPLNNAAGSEFRTVELYKLLNNVCDVKLWSDSIPNLVFQDYPINKIQLFKGNFPKTGTFVFIGTYWLPNKWIYLTNPNRIIIVHNVPYTDYLNPLVSKIFARNKFPEPEIVFASEKIKNMVNREGTIQPSIIDLEKFKPRRKDHLERNLTVGRMSRDVMQKHHQEDPVLYKVLAKNGINIKIMGGTCLNHYMINNLDSINLYPMNYQEPQIFIQSLDIFYYRTSSTYIEPSCRSLVEAMACGIPVIGHRSGGYQEYIEHGKNGFLFDNISEALELIRSLVNNSNLRDEIGKRARNKIEDIYSKENLSQIKEYYING